MASQASIQPIFAVKILLPQKGCHFIGSFYSSFWNYHRNSWSYCPKWFVFEVTPGLTQNGPSTLANDPRICSSVIGGIAIAAILAAILSTIGGELFNVTIATKDIYHGLINKKASDEKILHLLKARNTGKSGNVPLPCL